MKVKVYKFKGRWHVAVRWPNGNETHQDWSTWWLAKTYAFALVRPRRGAA